MSTSMERFYTVFCATDELHTSPAIKLYARLHDVTLTLSEKQIVSFVLPAYLHSFSEEEVLILYDPDMLDITAATLTEHSNNYRLMTNLTIDFTAKDVGTTSFGIVTPQNADIYPLKRYEPQFIRNNPIPSS